MSTMTIAAMRVNTAADFSPSTLRRRCGFDRTMSRRPVDSSRATSDAMAVMENTISTMGPTDP